MLDHATGHHRHVLGHQRLVVLQFLVYGPDKGIFVPVTELFPVPEQEVVVEDIQSHAGKAPALP